MQQFGGFVGRHISLALEVNGLISPSELCDLAGDLQFDGMFDGKESGFTPWIFWEFTIFGSRTMGIGGRKEGNNPELWGYPRRVNI